MNRRDRYLTGILLILVGVLAGTILTMYQQDTWVNDLANVDVTEVKRSDEPLLSSEELAQIDDRFLFKNVAKRVIPTVVYIEAVVPRDGRGEEEQNRDEDGFWDRILPRQARTVGSGVIISSDGYILTNYHVIEEAVRNEIKVALEDKRIFEPRVVGTDPTTDLAVIKIDARNLPSITVGNSDRVEVGEWVLAVGNPFNLPSTVTAGIVSALSRDIQIFDDQVSIESFIQTDAAINRGNSGGALVNTSGELIGINTAIATQGRSGNYQGYGFAVPSNLALKVARDIIEYGEVRRALLGVNIQSINQNRARALGMETIRGVEIRQVSPGSAAERYDLEVNDVILSVDGQQVNESNELQEKIALMHPGDVVKLKIWRNGETLLRNIRLGMLESDSGELLSGSGESAPEGRYGDDVEFESFPALGFRVMALSTDSGERNYELIVTDIDRDSEAWKRGMTEGDKIKRINESAVEDMQTLKDLVRRSLETGDTVEIRVEKKDGTEKRYQLNP